jgi:hypothetical protein
MMEGYFVRTLGMHRVYNSAFMNMLKNEENAKYRATIKNTMEFDPEILKRFVNFMNNPDEETAVAQFGKGDKYFGICTLLVTMPGLPMFGHGQIEGFEEKYGMEYRRAYRDEQPDGCLVDRHEREIFPLMKRRSLFSGSAEFRIYDLYNSGGGVNENVFAYSNRAWVHGREERALIFYNNSYYETAGWIRISDPAIPCEGGGTRRDSLSEALALHGESSCFALLREQRSNLWFIRSSKDLCENGLFVGLKGYETQVFLDIYEVNDDERGRWARLHHELQGRGVPDPHAAIMDIFLGELYYRFTEFFKPEIINTLHGFFINAKGEEAEQSFIESLQAPVEAFTETASRFIAGANGSFDAWAALDENGEPLAFTQIDRNEIQNEFAAAVKRLLKIAGYAGLPKAGANIPESMLAGILAKRIRERQVLCAVVLGYSLLSLLRSIIGEGADGCFAVSLGFDHWCLDRKLREQYRQFGASEVESRRLTDISRLILSRTAPAETAPYRAADRQFDPRKFAAKIIEENYLAEDFRRILGVNIFDDITWFNKEGFEELLFYGTLFFTVESIGALQPSFRSKTAAKTDPLPWHERIARMGGIYEALIKAEEKSGYRLDELLNFLEESDKNTAKSKGKKKR